MENGAERKENLKREGVKLKMEGKIENGRRKSYKNETCSHKMRDKSQNFISKV